MSLPKDNKDSIPEPVKGLEGIVAADTSLSSVNGEKGILRYCGYNIDDLAFNTTLKKSYACSMILNCLTMNDSKA